MNFLDFSVNSMSSSDDIFFGDRMDDQEINTINPDDFLNENFLSEFKTESEGKDSSSSFEIVQIQLTPPISPQPLTNTIYHGIQIIPVAAIQTNQFHSQIYHPIQEKKIIPIIPKPSSSSDSETNPNSALANDSLSKTNSTDIKQARLIRNRESALQSRRKKKEYLQNLEMEIRNLQNEVRELREENSILKSKLKSFNSINGCCEKSISSKFPTKNTRLLLVLILMIGFNLIPLGNFFSFSITKNTKRSLQESTESEFHSRHLLFAVDNVTTEGNLNDTNENEIEQEYSYLNQTDLTRKANIEIYKNIRQWIQADLFNVSNINDLNNFDFSYPLQDIKIVRMQEKSQDQVLKKKKKIIPKKKPSKNIPIQLDDSNFFKLHEFFEEIQRKEDTFYLFSFKANNHLLLPAIDSQNFSQIIKMNLIMPRNNETLTSDKITMMQIETIILNTSLIQVNEKTIPGKFKTYANSTATQAQMCNERRRRNFVVDPTKKDDPIQEAAKFTPYFQSFDLSNSGVNSRK